MVRAMTNQEWLNQLDTGQLAKFIRHVSYSRCDACAYDGRCHAEAVEEDFCELGVEAWLQQEHESCG